jgi:hypothetical protein
MLNLSFIQYVTLYIRGIFSINIMFLVTALHR